MRKKYICPKCDKELSFDKVSEGYFGACLECEEDFYKFEAVLSGKNISKEEVFELLEKGEDWGLREWGSQKLEKVIERSRAGEITYPDFLHTVKEVADEMEALKSNYGEWSYIEEDKERETENYNLSEIQLEALKKICPSCEVGRLYPVDNTDKEEVENFDYLWCTNCDMVMDESGGYIA